MSDVVGAGHLDLPVEWPWQLELKVDAPSGDGTAAKSGGLAGVSIRVRRTRAEEGVSAAFALQDFLGGLRASGRAETRLEGPIAFSDGVEGHEVVLELPVPGGVNVLQRHTFRLDESVLTHLTVTASASDETRFEGELRSIVRSFRPE